MRWLVVSIRFFVFFFWRIVFGQMFIVKMLWFIFCGDRMWFSGIIFLLIRKLADLSNIVYGWVEREAPEAAKCWECV